MIEDRIQVFTAVGVTVVAGDAGLEFDVRVIIVEGQRCLVVVGFVVYRAVSGRRIHFQQLHDGSEVRAERRKSHGEHKKNGGHPDFP